MEFERNRFLLFTFSQIYNRFPSRRRASASCNAPKSKLLFDDIISLYDFVRE